MSHSCGHDSMVVIFQSYCVVIEVKVSSNASRIFCLKRSFIFTLVSTIGDFLAGWACLAVFSLFAVRWCLRGFRLWVNAWKS